MKTCSACGKAVSNEDGLQLTDGRFFCTSGGCKKRFLDQVVEEEVVPDILRSGGRVVRYGNPKQSSVTQHPGYAAWNADDCERCHQSLAPLHTYTISYAQRKIRFRTINRFLRGDGWRPFDQLAGHTSAQICDRCVNGRRRLSLTILFFLLASLVVTYMIISTNQHLQLFFLPIAFILLGVYFILIPPASKTETGDRFTIQLKRQALREQGYRVFLTSKTCTRLGVH